jgi:hypothetical protein
MEKLDEKWLSVLGIYTGIPLSFTVLFLGKSECT